MAHWDFAHGAAAPQRWMAAWESLALRLPRRFVVAAALAVIGAGRLLPDRWLHGLDRFIGRPGDALLLLAVLVLLLSIRLLQAPPKPPPGMAFAPAAAILDTHLRMENEIDRKLGEVIGDTESSALAIIGQVRQLYDKASSLVGDLDGSSLKAGAMEAQIAGSVTAVVGIGAFITELPDKMASDLHGVQMVVQEIEALGGMVEAVQAISLQSHLLAINASIEASHAGAAGATFRVVADEMRMLALNSRTVATGIQEGLERARQVVQGGMRARIEESGAQLAEVTMAAQSIQELLDGFDAMNQYAKTRFEVLNRHNEELANDIAEVLGQIQYQDVVRQCIDRIRIATAQRNDVLRNAVGLASQDGSVLAQVQPQLETVLKDYLSEEQKHMHSARELADSGDALKIELF